MMPGTIERTRPGAPVLDDNPIDSNRGGGIGDHGVIVYNNDYNTVDQVVNILMRATSCTEDEALMETWEVHYQGRSVVHYASKEECEKVAAVIATIGIKVEVQEGL